MFFLDLDELDLLSEKCRLLSRNKLNWFTFRDRNHALYPGSKNAPEASVKSKIQAYLLEHNILAEGGKIMLLTNLQTLGYLFNPVSFYFCFDREGKALCAVAEVGNTFGEMKLYLLPETCRKDDTFDLKVVKNFYVSPFSGVDTSFNFILKVPAKSLNIKVNNFDGGKLSLLSGLTGKRKMLSDSTLLFYGVSFPFITLKIIGLIHWQAFLIFCKGIHFFRKKHNYTFSNSSPKFNLLWLFLFPFKPERNILLTRLLL